MTYSLGAAARRCFLLALCGLPDFGRGSIGNWQSHLCVPYLLCVGIVTSAGVQSGTRNAIFSSLHTEPGLCDFGGGSIGNPQRDLCPPDMYLSLHTRLGRMGGLSNPRRHTADADVCTEYRGGPVLPAAT